jgi:hypothetical protein
MVEADRPRPLCVLLYDGCGRWTSESHSYDPSTIHPLISYFQVFKPANVIFAGAGVLLLVAIAINLPYSDRSDTERTQTAKDVLGDLGTLMKIFKRIERFFGRLKVYAKEPTMMEAMKDVIVGTMVEVLGIFAILTKEIEEGRKSESITDRTSSIADRDTVTFLKKYLKRLIGRKDIEGTLDNLDGLTDAESITAVVQIWRDGHHTRSGVEDANKKLDNVDEKIDKLLKQVAEGQAGTFSTSAAHKCHPKPTLHTTSRQGKRRRS